MSNQDYYNNQGGQYPQHPQAHCLEEIHADADNQPVRRNHRTTQSTIRDGLLPLPATSVFASIDSASLAKLTALDCSYGPPQGQYGPPQGQYPQGQYGPPQGMQYQQGPPPQQQDTRGNRGGSSNCLMACLAALCCCCVVEESCECW
ncbi:hypothetical protein HC256_010209 [Beauveria bassiana]|nr:hypothetical protein HC256_010209 [Beauveria bassiana]